jgi:Arm DNA-binding domain
VRGSVIKRSKKGNSYTLVFDMGTDTATGRRKQQWVGFKGTKKEAEAKLSDLLTQI